MVDEPGNRGQAADAISRMQMVKVTRQKFQEMATNSLADDRDEDRVLLGNAYRRHVSVDTGHVRGSKNIQAGQKD